MPTLQEEFEAYKSLSQQRREFEDFKRRQTHEREMAEGGSIRATPESEGRNFPTGAIAGGTLGAIRGAAAGVPGAVAGAVIGAAVGQAGQEAVEQMTEDPGRSPSLGEAVRRVGEEAMLSGVSEVGGQALRLGKSRFPRFPFGQRLTAEGKESLEYLSTAAPQLQPGLTPGEATQGFGIDVLENIAESSFLGGGKIQTYKDNRNLILDTIADGMVDQFAERHSAEEIGDLFVQAAEKNKRIAQQPAQTLYNTISSMTAPTERRVPVQEIVPLRNAKGDPLLDAAGNPMTKTQTRFETVVDNPVPVSTGSLKAFVQDNLRIARELKGLEGEQTGDSLAAVVQSLPDDLTFEAAQSLRSRLLAKVDQLKTERKGAPAIGLAKQLIKRIDQEIEEGLGRFDQNALEMWRDANRIYREGEAQFNNRVVRSLKRKAMGEFLAQPEAVLNTLLRPNASKRIRLMRTAVGEANWPAFQGAMIEGLLQRATGSDGKITGSALERLLFNPKKGGLGAEALSAAYTPEQIATFRKFAQTVKLTQEKQASGIGRVFIQLRQAGAIVELAGLGLGIAEGEPTLESGILVFGPGVMARLLTNPRWARLFTEGLTINWNSPRAKVIWSTIGRVVLPRVEDLRPTIPDTAERRPSALETLPSTRVSPVPMRQ